MSKIAIIGGGIIGSSIAWNLAKSGLTSELIVIEPDPTYEFAATPRAIGGIRFVQGLIENLKMSLYGPVSYTHLRAHETPEHRVWRRVG